MVASTLITEEEYLRTSYEPDAEFVDGAVHEGPYTSLVAAWGELIAWAAREHVQTTQEAWERYLLGPKTTPDSSLWRTELSRPVDQSSSK